MKLHKNIQDNLVFEDDDFDGMFDGPHDIYVTGSHYTCDPPVQDTDKDYLVYWPCKDLPKKVNELCKDCSFELCGDYEEEQAFQDGHFLAIRNEDFSPSINCIITNNEDFADRWLCATHVAKMLNLTSKEDRIAIFDLFLYNIVKDPNIEEF